MSYLDWWVRVVSRKLLKGNHLSWDMCLSVLALFNLEKPIRGSCNIFCLGGEGRHFVR